MNPPCPYCQRELPKVPTRKSACPFCTKPIVIKKTPGLGPGFKLLTERDALILSRYELLNITLDEILEAKTSLPGLPTGDWESSDVLWWILNRRVQQLMTRVESKKEGEEALRQLKELHWVMARFVFEDGQDPTPSRREAARMDLLIWKRAAEEGLLDRDATKVEIVAAGDISCDACHRASGQQFTLNEALKQSPLPVKGCTHDQEGRPVGWCRCCFGIVET